MYLHNVRSGDLRTIIGDQVLVADDHWKLLLIPCDGILRHAVKVGGDHQVVEGVAEDVRQRHIACAGMLALHFSLQKKVSIPGILEFPGEICPVEAALVLFRDPKRILPSLMLLSVCLGHLFLPDPYQLLPGFDPGGFGCARSENKAVSLRMLGLLWVRLLRQCFGELTKFQHSILFDLLFHICLPVRDPAKRPCLFGLLSILYHSPKVRQCQCFSTERDTTVPFNRMRWFCAVRQRSKQLINLTSFLHTLLLTWYVRGIADGCEPSLRADLMPDPWCLLRAGDVGRQIVGDTGWGRQYDAVGALIKLPRMRSIHRLRQQTIQPGFRFGPGWICLRQIVRLRRTGRSMSAPTAGTTGPVAHTVCSYREATSYLLLLTSYLVRAGDVGRQIADATGGIAFPLGGRWHRASPASPMTDEGASVRGTAGGQ